MGPRLRGDDGALESVHHISLSVVPEAAQRLSGTHTPCGRCEAGTILLCFAKEPRGLGLWVPACAGTTALWNRCLYPTLWNVRFKFQTAARILARRFSPRVMLHSLPRKSEGARNAGLQPARGPMHDVLSA